MDTETLTISSKTDNLSQVEPFLAAFVKNLLDQSSYFNAVLALTEAVNNAIRHANKRDASKNVVITLHKGAGFLTMEVEDEGPGFIREELPDPTAPENLLRSGGRGIFLIESVCSSVDFKATAKGHSIIMRIPLIQS